MPSAVKWDATYTDRGSIATSELNSLANGAWAAGAAYDNSANLDTYACFEVALASLNPAAGAQISLAIVQAPDGTNYEDAPVASTNPGYHMVIATMSVYDNTAARRISSPVVMIPPGKFKIALLNSCGVALASSGNVIKLFTVNLESQ
jgi:hypothetical protein